MEFATVCGTRPELIKLSLLFGIMDGHLENRFIYTGQHYSANMSDVFFRDLHIRQPDVSLNACTSDLGMLTNSIAAGINDCKAEHIIVYGDTNSTLAAALAARKLGKKVVHIEAGARSFDKRMPEEKNRIQTDLISQLRLTPTVLCNRNLEAEGMKENNHEVGLTSVDTALFFSKKAGERQICNELGLKKSEYSVLTLHRTENVDDPKKLQGMLLGLEGAGEIVWPVHPRTSEVMKKYGIRIPKNIRAIQPLGYLDFLCLLMGSRMLLSDSGGAVQEAITYKIPVLCLRESTELWEAVHQGSIVLAGTDTQLIKTQLKAMEYFDPREKLRNLKNPYGEGKASEKIFGHLKKICEE